MISASQHLTPLYTFGVASGWKLITHAQHMVVFRGSMCLWDLWEEKRMFCYIDVVLSISMAPAYLTPLPKI